MGSSSSRDARPSIGSKSSAKRRQTFSDSTVELLISEHKLAPRNVAAETEAVVDGSPATAVLAEDTECPICYLNYTALNSVTCCKQVICTNCYVELRNAKPVASECPCPFCHQMGFLTKYTPRSRFDYSNDVQHTNMSGEGEPVVRRGSSDRNSFDPGALAGKAAEKISSAFDSIRSATTQGNSKTPTKLQAAPHHFTMQDSWSSPMQSHQADGKCVASSTPSSTNKSTMDGNTPQKNGPVVIPRASKADRVSIEAQIRSQHRDFDVDRDSPSCSHTRRASEGGTPDSGGPRPVALDDLSRMLAHMGAARGSGPASVDDVRRMEDMMLQAALRESAEMEEAAIRKRKSEEEEAKAAEAAAGQAKVKAELEATDALISAATPPPAPVSALDGGTGSTEERDSDNPSHIKVAPDEQEELEVQLALHNSAAERVSAEEEEELKRAIALSLEEASGGDGA